jgi:hypothetical protein
MKEQKNISEISKILKEKNFEIPYELYSKLMKVVYGANESKASYSRPQTSKNKFDMKKRA